MDAQAIWTNKVEALIATGLPRAKATAQVAKDNPQLRQRMLEQANARPRAQAIGCMVQAQAKARPRASVSATEFRQQVDELMREEGITRTEAARKLSQAFGLTEQQQSGGYFQRAKQEYFRR